MTYVKDFLNSNNLALIATLETRVKKHKAIKFLLPLLAT